MIYDFMATTASDLKIDIPYMSVNLKQRDRTKKFTSDTQARQLLKDAGIKISQLIISDSHPISLDSIFMEISWRKFSAKIIHNLSCIHV
jgi:hypothetical protein